MKAIRGKKALEDMIDRLKGLELAMRVCRDRRVVRQLAGRYDRCMQELFAAFDRPFQGQMDPPF
ncbi:hypothetical protein C8P63_12162 [Melghirimyces profundicolus]|uniref:Uncharacterized protein n=1 Tax=Melghirimyces profundicolus TaxID=1242148 RepID=A0A2T6BGJ5_9BACL|nr:hypothetical protein [Melghirimyces profundicolus]PTX55182.1 hypothetical protein C8P63_12162 [Melghirimyces profundicolus]